MVKIKGSIVALVTPFKNSKVDERALKSLVDFHIAAGTHAILPCGSTGESATLTHEEHCKVIEIVIKKVKGRVPVIAGSGSNSTHESIYLTKFAKKAGADAALLITPYYNKPTQEGLYEHYKAVSGSVDIPIILYNVPGRTGVNMTADTVIRLSHDKRIIGIKEASGNIDQASMIIRDTHPDFALYSGDDSLAFPLFCIGAMGVISVVNNVAPQYTARMWNEMVDGNIVGAKKVHYHLFELCRAMFYETNPIPVKKALYLMGMIEDEIRLPLTKLTKESTEKVKAVLKSLGIQVVKK